MADTLYLSLWYPNLRLEALPGKLIAVLGAFAAHGGEAKVYSATVWPVSWSEPPIFQRVYGRMGSLLPQAGNPAPEPGQEPGLSLVPNPGSSPGLNSGPNLGPNLGIDPGQAVAEALELLHDDYAYEFQIGWNLWELETAPNLDARWARSPRLVRVTGYGPLFDEGAYEQDGHIRIDFGNDAPFLEEDADLDLVGARHVEENVRQLVELTAGVEKASGATARLLWSELGESLAKRLAARLGMEN
ncbi:MAG TPA: hypothetical protein VGG45_20160 [Terracidiphilus sp.]|jgi:hypothetical protein